MLKDSVSFRCSAAGDPKPEVEWRRVGGESLSTERTIVSGGNLTIYNLIARDAGEVSFGRLPEWALVFVRDGIYNSVADYNSTWRVSSVCLSVCLSRGKLCYLVTFERFELEG